MIGAHGFSKPLLYDRRPMRKLSVLIAIALVPASCADHLPDQDLRITAITVPDAKLSSDDLWKDFQNDAKGSSKRYFGRSMDVSGKITAMEADLAKQPNIFFGPTGAPGVRGRLLDERAAVTLKDLTVGTRVTLRCFCEGINDKKDVLLKSCIRP